MRRNDLGAAWLRAHECTVGGVERGTRAPRAVSRDGSRFRAATSDLDRRERAIIDPRNTLAVGAHANSSFLGAVLPTGSAVALEWSGAHDLPVQVEGPKLPRVLPSNTHGFPVVAPRRDV